MNKELLLVFLRHRDVSESGVEVRFTLVKGGMKVKARFDFTVLEFWPSFPPISPSPACLACSHS
jgi:hypothetical protein